MIHQFSELESRDGIDRLENKWSISRLEMKRLYRNELLRLFPSEFSESLIHSSLVTSGYKIRKKKKNKDLSVLRKFLYA